RVGAFPRPGETISGATVSRFGGGKGANQALAAHRLGARTELVARVGNDSAAAEALRTLRDEGVGLGRCKSLDSAATGLALILVAASGENQIVVAPGANAEFDPDTLDLPAADAYIAQLETPVETVARAARECHGFFCLNAAPARPVPVDLLRQVDLLVVNELEAEYLELEPAGYDGLLAITYGRRGAALYRRGSVIARAAPPPVEAVDTTGAGDAFTAALTLALVSGMQPQAALERACLVGALTTRGTGAQTSPTAAEVKNPA
ncbi:MAG: ribokinase, partial [Lysobacterales bacterium]